jgi:uncharacterized protein (TIGR03067 family)
MTIMVRIATAIALFVLAAPTGYAQEKPSPREEEANKALLELQGTWSFESFEDSKKTPLPGLKKRTFFVGGNLFLVREGDKVLQAGTLRLSPGKTPKTIDAVVRKGEHEGNTMLGIYQLKDDVLEVCFDPEADSRPRTFTVKADSKHFRATYKRIKPADETIKIIGRYKSTSSGLDGARQTATAEIQKHGDAYMIKWSVAGGVAYIGIGIRKGNILSVAWANRGNVGVSVYTIEKGPKLVGTFSELGGPGLISNEVFTPGDPEREVRLHLP